MKPVSWAERAARRVIPPILGAAGLAVSYSHVQQVAAEHGAQLWASHAMAISVELMAIGAALEIRARRRAGQPTAWAWVVLAVGIVATVAANLETALAAGWGTAVAVWPAVAYLLAASLEATRSDPPPTEAAETAGPAPRGVPAAELPGPAAAAVLLVRDTLPGAGQGVVGPWDNLPDLDGVTEFGDEADDDTEVPEPDPLLEVARDIAAGLGAVPGRPTLLAEIRRRGHRCGTDRAERLRQTLIAEAARQPAPA